MTAEQENRIPTAEKELEEPTASEQPQLASGSNAEAQVPPEEREHGDYSANPSCGGFSQTKAMVTVVHSMI